MKQKERVAFLEAQLESERQEKANYETQLKDLNERNVLFETQIAQLNDDISRLTRENTQHKRFVFEMCMICCFSKKSFFVFFVFKAKFSYGVERLHQRMKESNNKKEMLTNLFQDQKVKK